MDKYSSIAVHSRPFVSILVHYSGAFVMNREQLLSQMKAQASEFDVIVIGGGASGLGTALDSVTRGYRTLLLERGDFAEGTSSRSTKLVHGGIRYLRQGHLSLVRKALAERVKLFQNAPHLVRKRSFIIPAENRFSLLFYQTGVRAYDLLARGTRLEPSQTLYGQDVQRKLPNVSPERLYGGVVYCDGQFDDARLAINLAQTIVERGGVALNYVQVEQLLQDNGRITGVVARDVETDCEYIVKAKVVVNATGTFSDQIRYMEGDRVGDCVAYSQGAHLVLPRRFFPGDHALVIPKTRDGRLLFLIPWHDRVLLGTTETRIDRPVRDPHPTSEEVSYLLENASRYLVYAPTESDLLARFAGVRPLIKPAKAGVSSAWMSRDHRILVSPAQLVSVLGGKWTTYRQIAEDAVNVAAEVAQLPKRPCQTGDLRIHGWQLVPTHAYYGSDTEDVEALAACDSTLLKPLHSELSIRPIDVIWSVRHEMARTVQDILARRTHSIFFDEKVSNLITSEVSRLMACELRQNRLSGKRELTGAEQKKTVTLWKKGFK